MSVGERRETVKMGTLFTLNIDECINKSTYVNKIGEIILLLLKKSH